MIQLSLKRYLTLTNRVNLKQNNYLKNYYMWYWISYKNNRVKVICLLWVATYFLNTLHDFQYIRPCTHMLTLDYGCIFCNFVRFWFLSIGRSLHIGRAVKAHLVSMWTIYYLGFDKCSNTFTSFSKIKVLIVLHLVLFNINIFCGILQWYTSLWNKNQKTFILNDDNFEQSCDFWGRQNHTT